MTAYLLTCAEFRALRAELSRAAMIERLPVLEREIAALEAVVQPILKAMAKANSKHEKEKIYARLENGEDWTLQWLSFERDAIMKALTQQTAVVHFHDVAQHWNKNTQTWDDERYVYIGRYNSIYNLPASKWANQAKVKELGRDAAIQWYRGWLVSSGLDVNELRGKVLICWCKKGGADVPCHGDCLVEALQFANTSKSE